MTLPVEILLVEIRRLRLYATRPMVVALDGRSGSGKSTLASQVAEAIGATRVPCDDFFAAGIPAAGWDARTPAQRAADAIDWRRLRAEAIEPLRAGKTARWLAFDFAGGPRHDGSYPLERVPTERAPSEVILLDGAYSARPELADLIDLAVLVEATSALRQERLAARENPQSLAVWQARWGAAEDFYFTQIRPPSSYNLVLTTGGVKDPGIRLPQSPGFGPD